MLGPPSPSELELVEPLDEELELPELLLLLSWPSSGRLDGGPGSLSCSGTVESGCSSSGRGPLTSGSEQKPSGCGLARLAVSTGVQVGG